MTDQTFDVIIETISNHQGAIMIRLGQLKKKYQQLQQSLINSYHENEGWVHQIEILNKKLTKAHKWMKFSKETKMNLLKQSADAHNEISRLKRQINILSGFDDVPLDCFDFDKYETEKKEDSEREDSGTNDHKIEHIGDEDSERSFSEQLINKIIKQ